jgi:hypothetical protein
MNWIGQIHGKIYVMAEDAMLASMTDLHIKTILIATPTHNLKSDI